MKQLILTLFVASLVLTGCSTAQQSTSQAGSAAQGPYKEISADGRIYVLGSEKMVSMSEELEAGHAPHLPLTQTFLGLGPNGETVILEHEKKGDEMVGRLLSTFCQKHPTEQPACKK